MLSKSLKYLIFILIAVIAAGIYYIYDKYADRNLSLDISVPESAAIGAPFEAKAEFSNHSGNVLKDVKLTINLPEGLVFAGQDESKNIESKELGDIGEGSLISETYRLIALKDENTVKRIKVSISYTPSSLVAHFEKKAEAEVAVKGSGILINLTGPEKVSGSEEFEIDADYKNVSEVDFKDIELRIEYPPNFSFIDSTLKPDRANNSWLLGDLRKGSEGSFTVKGFIIGPENSTFTFKTELKADIEGKVYTFGGGEMFLTLSPSPLFLSISVNDKQDYIAKPNDELNYILSYISNTDVALRDAVIRVQLVGEMFDLNTLDTNAYLRSSDNTLIWNSSNASEFNYLSPHSAGAVKFKIKTKENYPIRRFGDKNFILKIKAEIESPTIPGFMKADKTFSIAELETKMAGNAAVEAKGYFRDAASRILNKGNLPPKVGQPVNFTIHWFLKIFASDLTNVEVRAPLAQGVKFAGTTKSGFGAAPFYDEKNNQMVWMISKIPANKGVVDEPAEAVFQVEATPNASQIGKFMPLLAETIIKAIDSFTSLEVNNVGAAVDTSLPSDTTVGAQDGVVQP